MRYLLVFYCYCYFFFLHPSKRAHTQVSAASPNRVVLFFFFLTFALKSSHVVLPRARQLRLLHCAFSSQGSAVDENAHRDSRMLLIRRNTTASVSFGPNYRYRQSGMLFFFFFLSCIFGGYQLKKKKKRRERERKKKPQRWSACCVFQLLFSSLLFSLSFFFSFFFLSVFYVCRRCLSFCLF